MEMVRQLGLGLLQLVLVQQQLLDLDQPREPNGAYQKHCRLNSWSTMKQQLFHNQFGTA